MLFWQGKINDHNHHYCYYCIQDIEGYTEIDSTILPPASDYELPLAPAKAKKVKPPPPSRSRAQGTPSTNTQKPANNNNNLNRNPNYDIPEGVQGMALGSDVIQIRSSLDLKLPAEYDEVPEGSSEYRNLSGGVVEAESDIDSGYHMLQDISLSPTPTSPLDSVLSNGHSKMAARSPARSSRPQGGNNPPKRGKTLAAVHNCDYETPFDASAAKSNTVPADYLKAYDNYETPFDAST